MSERAGEPESARVLIVSPAQWPRALLRAELEGAGYDAVGTRSLSAALRYPPVEALRGPVRLLIVEQGAVEGAEEGEQAALELLDRLRQMHREARVLLLARGTAALPPGTWDAVLRRPVSLGQVVAAVKELAPLGGGPAPRAQGRADET